jgi:hypothetical protein
MVVACRQGRLPAVGVIAELTTWDAHPRRLAIARDWREGLRQEL